MTHRRPLLTAGALLLAAGTLAACSPTRALNAVVPDGTHRLTTDVAYGTHPRQRLDIYQPLSALPPGGYPVALFFYGGSWNSGERGQYKFVGEALASRGIVTLVADYRLYPEVRYPAFLEDCALALAYTLKEAARLAGNPERVFVTGHSAGAYNAAMLALDPRWLEARGHRPDELAGWVGLAGPYDFLPISNPDVKPVFMHPTYPPGTQPLEYAGRRDGNRALPVFLGAARNDDLVNPQRNTVGLAMRLESAGIPVTLRLYERVNHVTLAGAFARPLRWLAPVLDDVAAFLGGAAPT